MVGSGCLMRPVVRSASGISPVFQIAVNIMSCVASAMPSALAVMYACWNMGQASVGMNDACT